MANPLELPAEPEAEEITPAVDHNSSAMPAQVDESSVLAPIPNGNVLHEDLVAPTITRAKDPEARTTVCRQAGSSTAPESDVSAGQSQPLQSLVGIQPNGTLNGRLSAQTEIHGINHITKEKLSPSLNETEMKKKKQNLFVRTLWTLIMISGFLGAKLISFFTECVNSNIRSFRAFI